MFQNNRGNSIIEVVIVILILTIGITGTYNILNNGQKLSSTAENRIKAINISREGLEAVENIRDTNWLKFSSDYTNCWKVKDYNNSCVGNSTISTLSGSSILLQSGTLWMLSGSISPFSITSDYNGYRNQFPIYHDINGLTTHSGGTTTCSSSKTTSCKSLFTREIQISHIDADHMKINSIVTWIDSSKNLPYIINLETTLTNWKKKF